MDDLTAAGHPDLILVFKVSHGTDNRRVTYPRGRHCHFDSLQGTIERLFSLGASTFWIAYTDDDGDETAIKSDLDLSEAINYFASGFDDNISSYTSATQSTSASFDSSLPGGGSGGEKVTLRVHVVVEYDGPALSETGSIAESLSDRESGWGGGDDGASERSSQWTEGSEDWAEEQAERDRRDGIPSGTRVIIEDDWDDESIDLTHDPFLPPGLGRPTGPAHPLAQSFGPSDSSSSSSSSDSEVRRSSSHERAARLPSAGSSPVSERPRPDLSGLPHEDDAGTMHPADVYDDADAQTSIPGDGDENVLRQPPSSHGSRQATSRGARSYGGSSQSSRRLPSGPSSSQSTVSSASSNLEQSEIGARWLREQGEWLRKRVALPGGQAAADGQGGRRATTASSETSDDEQPAEGALALERGVSGKWYYNYSAGSSRDSFGGTSASDNRLSTGSSRRPLMNGSASASLPSSASASGSSASYSEPGRPHSPFAPGLGQAGGSRAGPSSQASSSKASFRSSFHQSLHSIPLEVLRIAAEEESGVVEPPKFAPDCSACGVRMTYMRYACVKCGEADKADADGNPRHHHHHHHPHHHHHHHHHPHQHPHQPTRDAARIEVVDEDEDDGYASDGTELVGHRKHAPGGSPPPLSSNSSVSSASSPLSSFSSSGGSTTSLGSQKPLPDLPLSAPPPPPLPPVRRPSQRGFELCVSCIELHGHAHAKGFFKRRTEAGGWDFAGRGEGNGHAFREIVWHGVAHGGWKDVEYDGENACSICAGDISRDRFKCVSCQKFDLCKQCFQRVEEIHPVHAFLSVPDLAGPLEPETSPSAQLVEHPGAFCHNCLKNIVGPRFHCAICPSWDLCAACESLPSTGLAGGTHSADHIMMKIPVPLGSTEVEQVSRRVRDQWLQQDAHAVGAQSDPRRAAHNSLPSGFAPRETSSLSPPALSPPATSPRQATSPVALPPPPLHPSRSSGSGPAVATFPPPPPFPPAPSSRQASREEAASGSRVGPWSLNFSMNGISFRRSSSGGTSPPAVSAPPPPRTGHRCSCDNCGTYLAGTRYQCANCPSDPAAFNLCPACEVKSYLIHDARHAFIRIDRPVDFPVRSRAPLLPILYSAPVGSALDPSQPPVRADVAERLTAVRNKNDPTAHLRFLYHPSTVCDFCMIPITGSWLRCAVCPSSFDLCSDCHRSIEHDRDHVFLVLKSSVDMQVFRDCTALSAETSRPLISQRLYLPS